MAPNQEIIEAKLCAYVDDELTAQERIEIEEHLAANPHHRRLLRELAQTRNLLRGLPRAKSPADLIEGFQSQLERSALLDDDMPEVAGAILRINRRPQVFAAAAMVLLAVGLAVMIYKTLPTNKPPREVAIGTPGPTSPPGLATSDDSGTAAGKPSGTPSAGAGPEGIAGDAGKDSTTTARPTGGGSGGGGRDAGTMGQSETFAGGGLRGKVGDLAKPSPGKAVAGPDDVISLQNKLAKAEGVRGGGIDATTALGGNLSVASGNAGRTTSNLAKLDEDTPVVVVVNATDTTLANGDVSSYLRQNKIAYIADTETASAPSAPSTLNTSTVLVPASAASVVAGVDEPAPPEETAKKSALEAEDKKIGWYMGSDGKMYYRTAADPADAGAIAKAKGPAAPAVAQGGAGVVITGTVAPAPAPTTQPLRGIELANSYGTNGNFGNSSVNPVTYRAVMSRRQVVDLNIRLSQRGGQSAEVRSDAIVNRPEGYALADNMRLNGATAANGTTVNAGVVTSNAISPSVLAKAISATPQPVTRAAKGTESGAAPADKVGDADQARKPAPTDESKTAPSAPVAAEQQKDIDPTERSRAVQGNRAYGVDRKVGEKNAQDQAPLAAQNAAPSPAGPAKPAPSDPQRAERQSAPAMEQPSPLRATMNEALQSKTQNQQKEPARPNDAVLVDGTTQQLGTSQQLMPPAAATASGSQEAAVQSASASAMKQLAADPDEQPREVLIVVTGQASILPASPAATPSTQPATAAPATRPAETTPRDSK